MRQNGPNHPLSCIAAAALMLLAAVSCSRTSPVSRNGAVAASSAQPVGILRVEVTGFRNAEGMARALLFIRAGGFPGDADRAFRRAESPIRDGKATLEFRDVPPGAYAVSVIHDANQNGVLDTNAIGLPREGFGVSGTSAPRPGPPRFDDARFEFHPPAQTLQITLRHAY